LPIKEGRPGADTPKEMMISLYRREEDGSLRYYIIHDNQLTLVPEHAFTVAWSVGPSSWRQRHRGYATAREADAAVRALVKRRLAMGYRLLYAFPGRERAGRGDQGRDYVSQLARQVR